ncbi:HDR080Wp [Eremothecium sinecaudum]|uniref:HDR080Wp n=1 Tax=Eremothecium sinecaudum TaxID=45286 RepID=A0A120K296_9SACH|nr:HDR080Wp [Eremothecium sinecaudum]AMD20822.1 HDR080Wp [Eremothecium sinecaudum]
MLATTMLRRPLLYSQRRFLNVSKVLANQAAPDPKRSPFNIRHLGVASEMYIPTSYKNLPSVFSSPIIVLKSLIRRVYTFGVNTAQVSLFRVKSGIKPNFLLWKNKAIECYVRINEAFVEKRIRDIEPDVTIWVQEALETRVKQFPKNLLLTWKLVKFNEVPKLMNVVAVMIPGHPLEMIQLTYKFDTKQRLIKYNMNTQSAEKLDKDVVEYLTFVCDATTNEVLLSGSVFESAPDAKLPTRSLNQEENVRMMKICGDIYRNSS